MYSMEQGGRFCYVPTEDKTRIKKGDYKETEINSKEERNQYCLKIKL